MKNKILLNLRWHFRKTRLLYERRQIKLRNRLEVSSKRWEKLWAKVELAPFQAKLIPIMLLSILLVQLLSPLGHLQKAFALNGNDNLNGYIWENDDGSDADGNSQLAAGNTSINAPKGSRLNLRAQIKNTGASMDMSKLGLFYDRGDGNWTKVKSAQALNDVGIMNSPVAVDTANSVGTFTDTVVDASGNAWVSYYDTTNTGLRVAQYVGSGGTGCASSAWTCTAVDTTNNLGQYNAIALDSSGNPWVTYYEAFTTSCNDSPTSECSLHVAKYVGSGGTGCASSAWTCTIIDNPTTTSDYGQYTSIAFDSAGTAYVSYYRVTGSDLYVAKYVGSGGTGCTGSTIWTCTAVITANVVGQYTSIAVDSSGNPWVSYYEAATTTCNDSPTSECSLQVAKYVSSGGTGCASSAWTCTIVDNPATTANYGQYTSIAIDGSGNAWVSYYRVTGGDFYVAKYVGSGGTGCTGGSTIWTCTAVETTNDVGQYTSIAFDGSGNAWVSYYDATNTGLRIAKYVSSGGSGCASAAWTCTAIETPTSVGQYTAIAFDPSGNPWISYYDSDNSGLRVVKVVNSSSNGCGDASVFTCTLVDNNNNFDIFTSVAVDLYGNPWVAYVDVNNTNLRVAKYVGSGGSGCTSSAWTCTDLQSGVSKQTSIAFDSSGIPWISYYDSAGAQLEVAKYVGSGGSGCTSSAWTCTVVSDSNLNLAEDTTIAFDPSNVPWILHYNGGSGAQINIAKYVGSGGNCDDLWAGSDAWTCTAVQATNNSPTQSSLAFDNSGNPWISYRDDNGSASNLAVAKYVGGGSGSGCTSSNWTCTTIETTNDVGQYTSIAFDPSGNAWISHYDATGLNLRVAKYVGGGAGSGCASSDWTCTAVETTNDIGAYTSIAFDISGNAWISYFDSTKTSLRLAKYVGGGAGSDCASSDWTCMEVDTSGWVGQLSTSIAFDSFGNPWISYYDTTNGDLRVATINRRGEVVTAGSQRGTSTLSESHVDMTSTSDTSNRDDADCIGGGTWNNGILIFGEQGSGTLPNGTGTAQCTEVMFTIDFSQAVVGGTYRFMVAVNDAITSGKNFWRGPVSIASNAIPTVTITDISYRFAKDNSYRLPDCADTTWGCDVIQSTNDIGSYSSIATDPSGNPWMSYYDTTGGNLIVAKYVGASGSGCASSAWTCTTVESTNDVGKYSSLAFDASGNPWVSYYEAASTSCNDSPTSECSLHIAKYVGSSGSGCASSAWTCSIIDNPSSTGDYGQYSSITFDASSNPWISYYDASGGNIRVTKYLGGATTGTGCTSSSWTCDAIETTNDIGKYSSIAIDPSGNPWISYYDTSGGNLRVANYAGMGGSGCAIDSWICTAVETTNDVGQYSSIAFDGSGNAWVSYYEAASTSCNDSPTSECSLHVAQYVGASGSGCASAAWTCTIVDNPSSTGDYGQYSSIAFDASGKAWVSFYDAGGGNLRVANYVSSSGSGCSSSAWSCTAVDTTNDVGKYSSIAFGSDGSPWVSYYDTSGGNVRVAKLHRPPTALNNLEKYRYNGRSARNGDGRYRLTLGRAATAAEGSCSGGISDYFGACALFQNSGNYDTITAQANESPYLNFAMRYNSNSELPAATWIGNTSLAPNTAGTAGDLVLQVYRAGSTNAWETITSDTASSGCSSDNCSLSGIPSGTASDYFTADGTKYWVYFRVYQDASTSTTITLKTDEFKAAQNSVRLGTSTFFLDGVKRPLNYR